MVQIKNKIKALVSLKFTDFNVVILWKTLIKYSEMNVDVCMTCPYHYLSL